MAETRRRIHETTQEKLAWLEELREASRHAGAEKAVERQRSQKSTIGAEFGAGKLALPHRASGVRRNQRARPGMRDATFPAVRWITNNHT